ncbi:y4mF family transcriptional regulator [Kineosphaera limosa]|uniref:Putative Xre family DNA-binding protein n=1 Tax=Kineosphaera limosa NBRC 100340 TaxID=1184609 RepID=K6WMC7_9MICO|nr:type II toxin-antitoxin system Y4mF family antitoxin [Kineosphaera limosa]NYE00588.1 y4mF family transcriptional regulator [Kineosphaera limosa]GAB94946.1 putative Xre family DNA-binding protein [Kineosphaera limosa NBRC 100340]
MGEGGTPREQTADDKSADNPRAGESAPTLGEQVRRRRLELGLLQAEVADLAGVSERFVRAVEHDKATIRLDKLRPLLEVLGLELTARLRSTT